MGIRSTQRHGLHCRAGRTHAALAGGVEVGEPARQTPMGGGGQALRVNSTGHKWEAQGRKGEGFGAGWLVVQPSSRVHQLCDLGRSRNLVGLSFLTCQMRTVTSLAPPSCSLSLSSPARSAPLHPLPAAASALPETCRPPPCFLAQTYLCHPRGPYSVCRGLRYATMARKHLARHLFRPTRHCRASLPTALSLDEPPNLSLGRQSAECSVTSRT